MVETVQKTVESPQLVLPLSVSVVGRLSSGDGLSDILDHVQFWRRRPYCVDLHCVDSVSPGDCGARSRAHEVLRQLFCERRMRCGSIWCSSYSSQWTGWFPGSCFLDKDVDVPVLATSWGCRGSAVAVHRLVVSSSWL